MKEIRGVDLDEVKYETLDAVLAFQNYKINNIPVVREDITDYHIHNIERFGIDAASGNQWFRDFIQSGNVHTIQPVSGAKEVLDILQSQGKEFVDITGRLEIRKSWTEEANKRHYPSIPSRVIYLSAYSDPSSSQISKRTKSEICKEIGVTVMIEDDLHYAYELSDNGIKVYLLAKPRNQQYKNGMRPNIIKINEWKDILDQEKSR